MTSTVRRTGKTGLDKALSGKFDLIILDVMLPSVSGFDICAAIRTRDRDQPIIMLTAKVDDDDIVRGLSLGADDYVAKPFSIAQLVLRVEAVLRRSRAVVELASHIRLGDDIDIDTRNLSGRRGGEAIAFTRREMDVLQYLHAHSSRAVSRDELLAQVWGYAKHARPRDAHRGHSHREAAPQDRGESEGSRAPDHRARRRLSVARRMADGARAFHFGIEKLGCGSVLALFFVALVVPTARARVSGVSAS